MKDKNFTRKEKSAYYSQGMQMYQGLYELTKEQIKDKGYASHKSLMYKIASTKNIVNAIRSISKNTGGRTGDRSRRDRGQRTGSIRGAQAAGTALHRKQMRLLPWNAFTALLRNGLQTRNPVHTPQPLTGNG